MNIRKVKLNASVLLVLFFVAMMSGCTKGDLVNGSSNGAIKFTIADVEASPEVKSSAANTTAEQNELFLLSCNDGSIQIPVKCEVTDGINPFMGESQTKGTLVNTSKDNTKHLAEFSSIVNKFKVNAYKSSGAAFLTEQEVTYSNGKWTYSPIAYWPQVAVLKFLAYANLPASGTTISAASDGQTLTHTVPSESKDQTDILLGYYMGTGNEEGDAAIRFEHPLTAVVFKAGELKGITSIKSITLKNVHKSGTTTQNASGSDFTWETSGTMNVTQSSTGDAFLLIPQNLSENPVELCVTVVLSSGSEKTLYAPLESGSWLSGKTNTYTLNASANPLEINIVETFDNTTKSNVKVENTGGENAYTRVAIVASWRDDDNHFVRNCNWMESTNISGKNWGDGKKWKLHTDGYFYYQKGIESGKSTEVLFESCTAGTPPIEGLHLDIEVIAQGVEYDESASKAKAVWGSGVPLAGGLDE